jgi:hypothetical protein
LIALPLAFFFWKIMRWSLLLNNVIFGDCWVSAWLAVHRPFFKAFLASTNCHMHLYNFLFFAGSALNLYHYWIHRCYLLTLKAAMALALGGKQLPYKEMHVIIVALVFTKKRSVANRQWARGCRLQCGKLGTDDCCTFKRHLNLLLLSYLVALEVRWAVISNSRQYLERKIAILSAICLRSMK